MRYLKINFLNYFLHVSLVALVVYKLVYKSRTLFLELLVHDLLVSDVQMFLVFCVACFHETLHFQRIWIL